MTAISEAEGFSKDRVANREVEIREIARQYGFKSTHCGGFPAAKLDSYPKGDLVRALGSVIKETQAEILYIPYRNDVHSDHAAVFDAAMSCSKWFRYPSVKAVYAYETLSETEFGIRPDDPGFRPNLFIDMDGLLERKIELMGLFAGEMAPFPFPRSGECIKALAMLRGSQAGVAAAEAFMILKEIR